jgi:hypothetical protein
LARGSIWSWWQIVESLLCGLEDLLKDFCNILNLWSFLQRVLSNL